MSGWFVHFAFLVLFSALHFSSLKWPPILLTLKSLGWLVGWFCSAIKCMATVSFQAVFMLLENSHVDALSTSVDFSWSCVNEEVLYYQNHR